MGHPSVSDVLHYVRSLVGLPQAETLGDAALLRRFAIEREEAALVSLLQRHGPLGLAACRQVLADPHAAEDAFQATFLMPEKPRRSTGRSRSALGCTVSRTALPGRPRSPQPDATLMRRRRSLGRWPRSGQGKTAADEAILKWMHNEAKDKTDGWWLCRTELEHYRAYTAESGLQAAMLFRGGKRGLPPLEKLLADYRPRMVTIEVGIYVRVSHILEER